MDLRLIRIPRTRVPDSPALEIASKKRFRPTTSVPLIVPSSDQSVGGAVSRFTRSRDRVEEEFERHEARLVIELALMDPEELELPIEAGATRRAALGRYIVTPPGPDVPDLAGEPKVDTDILAFREMDGQQPARERGSGPGGAKRTKPRCVAAGRRMARSATSLRSATSASLVGAIPRYSSSVLSDWNSAGTFASSLESSESNTVSLGAGSCGWPGALTAITCHEVRTRLGPTRTPLPATCSFLSTRQRKARARGRNAVSSSSGIALSGSLITASSKVIPRARSALTNARKSPASRSCSTHSSAGSRPKSFAAASIEAAV